MPKLESPLPPPLCFHNSECPNWNPPYPHPFVFITLNAQIGIPPTPTPLLPLLGPDHCIYLFLPVCLLQVVLSPGTHLYFDHPQEPDPEERGLYWACRFTDTRKVFDFAPDNLFSNADVRLTGEAFSTDDLKALMEDDDFTPLEKPENIIGEWWLVYIHSVPDP